VRVTDQLRTGLFSADLLNEVIGDINTFREMEPEEDESWQSWYEAAFLMLISRIRETFERNRIAQHAPPPQIRGSIRITKQAVLGALAEFQRSQKVNPEYDLIDHLQNAMAEVWPAPADHVAAVKTSIDTMREAAKDLLVKNGWKPGSLISGHSAVELMAAFGMQVYRGEVGCDYPDCGCCADAACGDAVKQHPDLGGTPIAIATEGSAE
jgi:hypothetical protein